MTDIVSNISLAYVIIVCNFLAQLFSCDIQRLLTDSMWAKHVVGVIAFFFLVTILGPSSSSESNIAMLWLTTLTIYAIFFLSTRMKLKYTIFLIVLLLVYEHLKLIKKSSTDIKTVERLDTGMTVVKVMIVIVTLTGVTHYLVRQHNDFGKDFSIVKFFFGTTKCKFNL